MLELHFEGWIQVRLATDPDPADDPRGVSGWTFAVAGEPDLDRIVRLQHADALRCDAQPVGVTVRRVVVDGVEVDGHRLEHASVNLVPHRDEPPRFQGRNGILAPSSKELIDPFHLVIERGTIRLTKRDRFVRAGTDDEYEELYLVPRSVYERRQPARYVPDSQEVRDFIGMEPEELRRRRRVRVDAGRLAAIAAGDVVAATALAKRSEELGADGPRVSTMRAQQIYDFPIQGPGIVEDPDGELRGRVRATEPWPVRFWLGGWDADALQAYMRGTLTVPLDPPG